MQKNECTRNCWIAAAVIGFLVWIFVSFIGETSVFGGLFLGLIAAVLSGLLLVWALCRGSGSAEDDRHHGLERANPNIAPLAATVPPRVVEPVKAAVATPAPSQPAPKPEPKPEPKPATAQPAATAKPEAAKPEAAKPAAEKKAEKTATAARKPAKATKAAADDLKEIKGVGPKLEQVLHDNGITRFAQIAGWSDAEIDEFAEKIGSLGGRIRSDDWVAQARTLAEGGTTEHAQKVRKGEAS